MAAASSRWKLSLAQLTFDPDTSLQHLSTLARSTIDHL